MVSLCVTKGLAALSLHGRYSAIATWAPKLPELGSKSVFPWRRLKFTKTERPILGSKLRVKAMSALVGQGDEDAKIAAVQRVRSIISDPELDNRWDECWKQGVTPWDVGQVTPVIQALVDLGNLPDGRALVPGCGSGHDVLALASESRRVVGLDISKTAIAVAQRRAAESPKGAQVEFLVFDFFNYTQDAPFSLIFDYTFFCAIDVSLRPAWAAKMAELLAPDGELITLMFPLDQHEGGPPFAVSVTAYEDVLQPQGLTMVSCEDNGLAVGPRKGKEKLARWKKLGSNM